MTLRCQAALRMLRERARQFMASGMAACVARANDNLFELTKAAPDADAQTQYLDAMRLWHGARRGVADARLGCVDHAFTALGARSAGAPAAAQGLVSDEELEEIIAIDTMAAAATEPMREALGRLLGRVEALCGATLTPREFPLMPHFMLTHLAREIGRLGLAPQARLAILRACHETQSRTLPGVVAQADALLDELGVTPRGAAGHSGMEPGLAVSRTWVSRRVSAAESAAVVGASAASGVVSSEVAAPEIDSAAPGAELCALLDDVRGPAPTPGSRRVSIRTRLEGALLRRGRSVAELGPEVVDRVQLVDALFDEMASGTWITAALGELLAAAEVPVLALASADPTFLAKPLHPARRLLQEIIVAATDFLHMEDYADQELFRCADATIRRLMEARADTNRLATLLIEFVARADRERERAELRAEPALRAASAQERTDAAHARVARLLDSRLQGRRYPLALIDMLEHGWCRVLFDAWFTYGEQSSQWRGAVHLLDQLVGVMGDAEPDQELVARLLETVAARLDAIAFDRFDARCLLDGLRLCLGGDAQPSPVPPSLVLTPAEARELNDPRLLVTVDGLHLALPGDMAPVANDFSADLDEIDLGRADALRPGGWVEFRDAETHRCRARLLGVVQPADTHVFGDPDGTVVRRLPRLRLALALREGSAIALDNVQFFDRALAQARSRIAAECG
ncbi:MAG: DUF1631 family protein [Porticoccaceae bacterium]